MTANTLDIPKEYADGEAYTEAIIDGMSTAIEEWATFTVNNLNQLRLDILGTGYSLDNDGVANRTTPLVDAMATLSENETVTGAWTFSGNVAINANLTLNGILSIYDSDDSHRYILGVSNLAADRTITLPLLAGNDVFVFADFTQTLTNKTLTAPILSGTVTGTYTLGGTPTISSPILSGTVTGTYTLGGTPTILSPTISTSGSIIDSTTSGASSALLNLNWRSPSPAVSDQLILNLTQNSDTTQDAIVAQMRMNAENVTHASRAGGLLFDTTNAGTLQASFSIGSTGGVGIISGQKIYLDGVSLSGDTYITEGSANRIDLSAGGTLTFQIDSGASMIRCGNSDVRLNATYKLRLDGSDSGDTYISEGIDNNIYIYAGGNLCFWGFNTGAIVNGTLSATSTIRTALNKAWDLGGFTGSGDSASNGSVAVTIDGVSYKLMTKA